MTVGYMGIKYQTADNLSKQGPIFIGGPNRSGKTYIRLMLSSHPDIIITRRTNMWPRYYNKFGDLSQETNFENCLAALMKNKKVHDLQPDSDRIRTEFWQGPKTYASLFELIHIQYAQRIGKRRWGDQTEMIERFADQILSCYPDARFIHLIRDPRDRFEASLAKKKNTVGEATAKWLYSANLAVHNQQKYPDRYKIVRYETMVSEPKQTLEEICTFLQEIYMPSMLTMEEIPRFQQTRGTASRTEGSPLSVDYIGRYQQFLPKRDIAFIHQYAGRVMRSFGYSLTPCRMQTFESFRYFLLDWPVLFGRMAAWNLLKKSA
jgi:hypothetical protein